MSILDLVENKPKMTSIRLADYDEGGNDKGIDCGEVEMVCVRQRERVRQRQAGRQAGRQTETEKVGREVTTRGSTALKSRWCVLCACACERVCA